MASFRTGFKIFGEISVRQVSQGIGRIRSFSEDRKPGQWLPEDQWAVRHPGSTCPDPCEKPKKPPKTSKSWLSICKDPVQPPECDLRHTNCSPPPPPVKADGPWYSLDNLMPKKKPERPPPLRTCREEMKRREMEEEEEVCDQLVDKTFPVDIKPEFPEACMPKTHPCPAPVVTLSCPLPKELDIMLWCGRPSRDTTRIAAKCQTDRLPYQEFRPQKTWKPPPFSLPSKAPSLPLETPSCRGVVPYSEFKHVDIPKPLYTRYKSVELSDTSLLLRMVDAKCSDDKTTKSLAIYSPPPSLPPPSPSSPTQTNEDLENEKEQCPEKPILQVGPYKSVRINKAPKYTFQPKPTKLTERRVYKNPCAQHKNSDLKSRHSEENRRSECTTKKKHGEPPKVLTGTLTSEPQTFEGHFPTASDPPKWMYVLCKPGSRKTPLVPHSGDVPKEPDWSSETDGLKFYDGDDAGIVPKPPPDPCAAKADSKKIEEPRIKETPAKAPIITIEKPKKECVQRFVLMPERYNIKNKRPEDPKAAVNENQLTTIDKFIESKTGSSKKNIKLYPPIKENILYDLQRLCPNPPVDPSKLKAPSRKPPEPVCPEPQRFYRSYSTFTSSTKLNFSPIQLFKTQRRTDCGDSSEKCKPRKLVPKAKECPEKKTSRTPYLLKQLELSNKDHYAGKVKCSTLKPLQGASGEAPLEGCMLGLKDESDNKTCEYEQRIVVAKQKKPKKEFKKTKKNFTSAHLTRGNEEPPMNKFLLEKQDLKTEDLLKSHIIKDDEVSLTLCNSPAQITDNSKPFIGSIGSWINDLFNVPVKRPHTTPNMDREPFREKEPPPETDSEYLKSITALKERFRKKLQKETSVHIFMGDRLMQFDFERLSEKDRKTKRNLKPLHSLTSLNDLEEINNSLKERESNRKALEVNNQENSLNPRTHLQPTTKKEVEKLIANNPNLLKSRRARNRSQVEKYVIPTARELTKRLLLNVNDQEKCNQLYKNSHLAIQEGQPYGQRKNNGYQSNTRWYTTDANVIDNNSEKKIIRPFTPISGSSRIGNQRVVSGKSSKKLSKYSRESSTYVKVKSAKVPVVPQVDPKRNEAKASSDELVKYLMKKIKMNTRPPSSKKKSTSLAPVMTTTKNRIMQSATNSLVMSVIAKKDTENHTLKNTTRHSPDKNDLLNRPSFQSKEWAVRYNNNNIRYDLRRAISPHGFNRTTYLTDDDKTEEVCLYERSNPRNMKRQNIDLLKREMREFGDKYNKKQDVKNVLSRLDAKNVAFQVSKIKQRDQKKNQFKNETVETYKIPESKDGQNPRFQKQHELFKSNAKAIVSGDLTCNEEKESEIEASTTDLTSPSKELAVINTNLQLLSQNTDPTNLSGNPTEWNLQPQSPNPQYHNSDFNVVDCLTADDKSLNFKEKNKEKNSAPKEKLHKTKSQQYIKEEESKALLGSLPDYCKTETPTQKEATSNVYESPICTADLRAVKTLDTVLLNRRFSTKTLTEFSQSNQEPKTNKTVASGNIPERNPDEQKKKPKSEKKEKVSNNLPCREDSDCGFEKTKKPGPRCENDE